MKRIMTLLLALILLTSCTSQAPVSNDAGNELIVVGFSQVGAESDWRNANTASMRAAFSEENGYRLMMEDGQQKQERQITAIRNFIHQDVDYIVLAPTTESGWETVLLEAKAADIPVIIVDRMIDASEDLFTCWVGSDFRKEGDQAVAWLEEHFADAPLRIVHLQGNLGSSAQLGRTNGLDAGLLRNPQWTLVNRDTGFFTQAKGQELVSALLAQGVQFDVIYSENDNMAYGAIEALRGAGIAPGRDVTILSFDASHHGLELVMSGQISYNVECNPLHGPRVRTIIEQLEAGTTPPKLTFVDETAFGPEDVTTELLEQRGY